MESKRLGLYPRKRIDKGLDDTGFIEGPTVKIEYRWANGDLRQMATADLWPCSKIARRSGQMTHRMRAWLVAALVGIAWTVAPSSPSDAQGEISGGVVKLGVLTDETGVFSSLSGEGSIEATRMAVEDFGGKVAGKPIEIIHADHQNKTDIGAAKSLFA